MEARLGKALAASGVAADGVSPVLEAYRAAMEARGGTGDSGLAERDPAFLHPGRTVLILLDDLLQTDARILAAAAMAESRHPDRRVGDARAAEVLGGWTEPLGWWRSLPGPDWWGSGESDDLVLEQLVTGPEAVLRIALADALDHVRHAHLWPSADDRHRAARLARNVFAPAATRAHPVLERRFNWWIERVATAPSF